MKKDPRVYLAQILECMDEMVFSLKSKSSLIIFISFFILVSAVSCTKSDALTGSGSSGGSFSGNLTGSVNGGLSPISGAIVSLYVAGTTTSIANATTTSSGAYSLNYTNPGNGLYYLTATGGNAGNGTNNKIQLMAILGSGSSVPLSANINELTTASAATVAFNMGILNDTSGIVTLNAPKNAAGAANVATQNNNLVTNSGTTAVNTGNANVTSSMKNALNTMANALAACVQNVSNCSTLFNSATTSSGMSAVSLLDAISNMLNNSSNVSSSVYTLAFPLTNTTGFTLPSSSIPGGFTFNNALGATVNTFPVAGSGAGTAGIAFDASGNAWITNRSISNVKELSPSGGLLGTFTAGTNPNSVVIDSNGNIWVVNQGSNTVTEFNSQGTTIGTFAVGSAPEGIAIDGTGNVWVTNLHSSSVTELSSSGAMLATVNVGGTVGANTAVCDVIDASGNFG